MVGMKTARWMGLCIGALWWCLDLPPLGAVEAEGWIPLFDGRTLDGWKASENPGGFRVANGTITFDGARSHLFYVGKVQGADFKNFELKADVRTEPGANSGIFFHTAYQEAGFPVKGFEAQVANTHVGAGGYIERKKTGSLYGIRNLYKAIVQDNEWSTMHICVRNRHVQIRVNDFLAVDYIEPENPLLDVRRPGRRISRGTFALQGHDPDSKVSFRNIRVKPLPDELPFDSIAPAPFDKIDEQIVKLGTANYPLVDFHTHLKGGLTLEGVFEHMRRTGINHGIAVNCGLGFAITNDVGIESFLESMAGKPVFVGMQAEGREWPQLFSKAAIRRFDYVFTDSMTIFDPRGKRMRLWIREEVEVLDKQSFMDHLADTTVKILEEEPIDIYVNPTFLPDVIAAEYDVLWTPARMQRVIGAAQRGGVAIEINSRYRLPSAEFIRRAKAAGLKFTLGVNNVDADLGRSEYGLEMIAACGLESKDFWMPTARSSP